MNKITEEQFSHNTEKIYKVMERIRRAYSRGIMTRSELVNDMWEVYRGYFLDFLHSHSLYFRFENHNWGSFSKDYDTWKTDPTAFTGEDSDWLEEYDPENHLDQDSVLMIESVQNYGYDLSIPKINAGLQDMIRFFRLMDVFFIDPEFFRPMPPEIIAPRYIMTHDYADASKCVIDYHCTEDNGLLSCDDPVGKRFKLKDALGLTAIVTITEDRSKTDKNKYDDIDDYYPLADYAGEGYVEGYTVKDNRKYPEMTIRLDRKGCIRQLGVSMDMNDYHTGFMDYPLWAEYHQWENRKRKEQSRTLLGAYEKITGHKP